MALVIQKFGGTSVATNEAREALLGHVTRSVKAGDQVVLVVSAMGRAGDPYATDTLINLLTSISPDVDDHKKDLIMSCGEIISSSVISHLLESNGIPAVPLTGKQAGITTTNVYGNSEISHIDTTKITDLIGQGKVPVIAGFQGCTSEGDITTLGRGQSDTAAVIIGGYLQADVVDIFTDVEGIANVDPLVVPEAAYFTSINYEDMFRLANNGAKVIHPKAVKEAEGFNIPVRVRSTFTESGGTIITKCESYSNNTFIGMALSNENNSLYLLCAETPTDDKRCDVETFFKQQGCSADQFIWEEKELKIILPPHQLTRVAQSVYGKYLQTG